MFNNVLDEDLDLITIVEAIDLQPIDDLTADAGLGLDIVSILQLVVAYDLALAFWDSVWGFAGGEAVHPGHP